MVQGLSVGGEYGTTATYMSEVSLRQTWFDASFQYVTLIGGQLLASLVVLVVQLSLTDAELRAWGWRIPFLIGALCAIVALYLRMSLHETSSEKPFARRCGHRCAIYSRITSNLSAGAGLYGGWLADLLHVHDLYAEISGQHRAHGSPHGEHRYECRAVHLYDHAAAVRCAVRQDRAAHRCGCSAC
jgi:MFS family permease